MRYSSSPCCALGNTCTLLTLPSSSTAPSTANTSGCSVGMTPTARRARRSAENKARREGAAVQERSRRRADGDLRRTWCTAYPTFWRAGGSRRVAPVRRPRRRATRAARGTRDGSRRAPRPLWCTLSPRSNALHPSQSPFCNLLYTCSRVTPAQEQHIISSLMAGTALDTAYTARSFNGIIGSTLRL